MINQMMTAAAETHKCCRCAAAGAVQLVQQLLFLLSEGMNMKGKASEEKPLKGCIWESIR
jgi:hypothetical protein